MVESWMLRPEIGGGVQDGIPMATVEGEKSFRPIVQEVEELEVRRMKEALEIAGGVQTRAAALLAPRRGAMQQEGDHRATSLGSPSAAALVLLIVDGRRNPLATAPHAIPRLAALASPLPARRRMRRALVALVVLVLDPAAAHGNGRPAATVGISIGPTEPARLVTATTFGALVSDDGGVTWRLVCEGPLGTADSVVDPLIRMPPGGLMLESTDYGVYYSRSGGCDFAQSTGSVSGESIADLAVSPADSMRVLAITSTGDARNAIHVSSDGGASFAAGPGAASAQTVFRSLAFAPSDPQRVYALAYDISGAATRLYVSQDGGGSFAATPFAQTGETAPLLIGVHPRNAQMLYYQAQRGATLSILRSQDGGQTFQPTGWNVAHVYGAAFALGGALYLATDTGVRKSADGITLAPAAPGAVRVTCLGQHGGALYGCATEADGFSLGRSQDGGATFTPILRFGRDIVGPLLCGPGTEVCSMCYPQWSTFASQFGLPNTETPACVTGVDAGVPDAAANEAGPPMTGSGEKSGTSSCAVGDGHPEALAALLLALAACVRPRRRR